MRLDILFNLDGELSEDDPAREAREDVTRVAAAMRDALREAGHEVRLVPVGADPFAFLRAFDAQRPDLVVNLCESIAADARGEMCIPAILDTLQIPYTGSGPLALGLCLHKNKAKEILRARGVPTPEARLIERESDLANVDLPFPLIVKPSREDASSGIESDSVVHDRASLGRAVRRVLSRFLQPALVERYVDGREIYVPVFGRGGRHALPITEVRFGPAFDDRPRIVSYSAKWLAESAEFRDTATFPAVLTPALESRVRAAAIAAFEALEGRDYGRVDLRVTPEGEPYVIDVNPNCDLAPDAGFARAAVAAGLGYAQLCERLVAVAWERTNGRPPAHPGRPRPARAPAQGHLDVHAARSGLRARADRSRAHAEPSGLPGPRRPRTRRPR